MLKKNNIFEWGNLMPKIKYLVIDASGDGNDVYYSSWTSAMMSLLEEKGIGDKLERRMYADSVKHTSAPFNMDRSDWFVDNAEEVEAIATAYGYKILQVLK